MSDPKRANEEEERGTPVSRRALLAGAAFGVGAGVGAGATAYYLRGDDLLDRVEPVGPAEMEIPEDHVPFSVWEEIREAVQTSPDHLPGRAEILVASGDLEEIFEFVRDEVVTVPTDRDGTQNTETGTRWGVRGTLRCGMGTPRDKADLLADLYRRAGYDATVVAADDDLSEEDIREHYTQRRERPFDPEIEEGALDDWLERLGADGTEESEFNVIDGEGEESAAIADRVRAVIGDPTESRYGPSPFSWEWGGRNSNTPLVEIPVGGESRYANLFADVPFGEAGGEVSEIRDRDEPETVRVSLSAVTPRKRDEPMELVSGEWPVTELLGRQLLVGTPSVIPPYEQPEATIGDVDTFTPALALQGLDLEPEEAAEASVFGDPFTLYGDRLSATDDGVISRNGEPFVRSGSDIDLDRVASLSVVANPIDYPMIQLEVTATDDDGGHIEGLPADVFSVTDEETGVMPTMTEAQTKVHVMFIRDASTSMRHGVDAAMDDKWYDELRSVIRGHESAIDLEYRQVDSDMWTHLTDAVADGPDLIIYAHDGGETDEYVESMDEILAEAPPTVLLSAYDEESPVETQTVLSQAELTGGVAVPMGETETVHEVVIEALDALELPTYRFDYHVPDTETGERTVSVSVENEEASTTYEPRARNPIPRGLVGLYLTVESGGSTVTRTLGGWDPDLDGEWNPYRDDPDTDLAGDVGEAQAHALDVHSALLGGVTLSFEGDGVPYGVALDEFLGANGTYAHMDVAAVSGEREAMEAAVERGGVTIPYELLQVQSGLPEAATERGVTFFEHARVALAQQKPILGTDRLEQSIDVLPLSTATTTAEDPEERFVTTLSRTARIAVVEATAYEISTASLLEGADLTPIGEFDAEYDHRASYSDLLNRAGFARWDHQLLPADGSAFAFWNVDAGTGTLTGVIDDGTGGGRRYREIEERLDRLSQLMSMYNFLLMAAAGGGAISGLGAVSLGIVSLYGQQLARIYAGVTLVLMTMDTRHLDIAHQNAIAGMVCGLAWQITFGALDAFGGATAFRAMVAQIFDNIFGASGVSTPTSCGL